MKRIPILSLLLCALVLATVPSSARAAQPRGEILCTHLASEETIYDVERALTAAGLPGTQVFIQRAREFAALAPEANLAGEWTAPENLSFDLAACMDGWESANDFSDANCRMTAFTLLGEKLQGSALAEKYEGTYLMFDMDAVESFPRYQDIFERRRLFFSLFGEADTSDLPPDRLAAAFPAQWAKWCVSMESGNVWLMSVVIHDPFDQVMFVGHAGVLIQDEEGWLLVEKLAFEQPYQATRAERLEDIVEMLCRRPEYFGEGGSAGPFFYLNDLLLYDATGLSAAQND